MWRTACALVGLLLSGCSSDRAFEGRLLNGIEVDRPPNETRDGVYSNPPEGQSDISLYALTNEVWKHGAIVPNCRPWPHGASARIKITVSWEVREITPPMNCLSTAGKMLILAVRQRRAVPPN